MQTAERDSSSDDEEFGVQSPPLTKLIGDTLRRYPEGGQILKELIQNADDAGATEVKFLLDHRQHSSDDVLFPDCNFERFQGPALYAWNNAIFKDNDWQSIGKIGQSRKKDDPIKVGRFGLGFLSVFHITDLPMIVSGKYLGLIDPHRYCVSKSETSPAGLKEKLKNVFKHESHVSTFDGVFGLSRDTKSYNGTVFRFPFRKPDSNSEISKSVYTPERIKENIFEAFKSEAPFALLFLKNVQSIGLYEWKESSDKEPEFCFEIGVDKHIRGLVEKEKEVCKEAARAAASVETPSDEIFVQLYSVTFIERDMQGHIPYHWLTVNVVGTTDELLTELKTELSVLPWVGLAIRLPNQIQCSACTHVSSASELTIALEALSPKLASSCVTVPWSEEDKRYTNGRAFCFLPLPDRTELPVNVHGYFAVADNRQSIKWPGNDEKGNEALWNKELLYKLVAPAYALLLACRCELVKYSDTPLPSENSSNVTDAFSAWPLNCEVKKAKIWSEVVSPMVQHTLQLFLLWTAADEGKWVKFSEAYFLPSPNTSTNPPCPPIVIQLLIDCNVPVVSFPNDIRETVESYENMCEIVQSREITPQTTRHFIAQNPQCCTSLSKEDLYSVLEYVITDLKETDSYEELLGLPLLPIRGDNKAVAFDDSGGSVKYLFHKTTTEVLEFLPGIDDLIVDPNLPVGVTNFLCHVCEEGLFQLQLATADVISSQLLEKSIMSWCNATSNDEIWAPVMEAPEVETLLKKLWQWIEAEHPNLNDLPVVPVCNATTGNIVQLYSLSDSFSFCALPSNDSLFLSILRQLHFVVIENSIVPFAQFEHLFPIVTPELVVQQLKTLEATVCVKAMTQEEKLFLRNNLLSKLSQEDLDDHSVCLKSLPIYQAGIIENSLIPIVSEEDEEAFLPPKPSVMVLPMAMIYPSNMLNPSDSITVKLAESLGTEELSFSDFCIDHMIPFALENTVQNRTKGEDVLKWILQVLQVQHHLQESSLMDYLSDLPFINARDGTQRTPAELYDPDDNEFLELFDEEDGVFPHRVYVNFQSILQKLGMKTWKAVKSSPELLQSLLLDRAQSLCDPTDVCETVVKSRGKFILETLSNLCRQIDIDQFSNLSFLLARDRPDSYPSHLDWCSSQSHKKYSMSELCLPHFETYSACHLIGSVLPILSDEYGISQFPLSNPFRKITAFDVAQQLSCTSSSTNSGSVDSDDAVEMNAMVLSIYNYFLDKEHPSLPECCVWWQDADPPRFFSSDKFVAQFPSGLHVEPYFYATNKGYLRRFQELLGIKQTVDHEDVVSILDQIKHTCDSEERKLNANELAISVSILDWLREEKYKPDKPILIPTAGRELVAANECIFDDRELFKRASSTIPDKAKGWIFVSEKITSEVARYFDVPPLCQKVAPSKPLAISFKSAGQHESITQRISHIVSDYETDIDIFKELIQNADDAGATEVKLLLDWRSHPTSLLITDELKHWQGPALIAYNNAKFTDKDFTHICKLAGESKKSDAMKTGRFGVGFCATYHLTDLPSFISRRYLTIFDPHTEYLGDRVSPNQPGMRVDLVENGGDLRMYEDQFLPYNGVFDCNIFSLTNDGYQGTLFRFPYRTSYTKDASKISKKIYDRDQIQSLVTTLKQEEGNILLFLRSVRKVTLYELRENAKSTSKMSELYSIECNSGSFDRCALMQASIPRGQCETQYTTASVHSGGKSSDWIISSAHGCHTNMPAASGVNQDRAKGLLPFAEIALRVKQPKLKAISVPTSTDGKLFCFLPMPKYSGLSFHVNGFFDVSHDRRSLRATDDKTFGSLWNEHIAKETLHIAFINLLTHLASQCTAQNDCLLEAYYNLWKFPQAHEVVTDYLHTQFSAKLPTVKEKIIWSAVREGTWLSPTEIVVFKDETIASNKDVVSDVTDLLIQNGYNLVQIPDHVLVHLEQSLRESGRIIDYERFCSELLFPRIDEVSSDVRDRNIIFLLHMLGERSSDDLEWAISLITETPCVPCQSSPELKTPQELIDCRRPLLAKLYSDKDGKFPSEQIQQSKKAMQGLCNLGMSSEKLTLEDLKERACTVQQLANENHIAAMERSQNLLLYISKVYALNYRVSKTSIQKAEKKDRDVQKCLSQVSFLPVLEKPANVHVPWHGKANTFICPSEAYSSNHSKLLFTQCDMVSLPSDIPATVLSYLGVLKRNEPTVYIVLEHLECIIDNLPKTLNKRTLKFVDETVIAIYSFIDEYSSAYPNYEITLPQRCVWWLNANPPQFFEPTKFVQQVPFSLEPYFYATSRSPLRGFQKLLGIKHRLSCEDGLSILEEIHTTCDSEDRQLKDHELTVCVSVLNWLLKEKFDSDGTILIPTTNKVLKPAQECLFDDRQLFDRTLKAVPKETKEWSFVSEKITSEVARNFKVPPLSQKVAPSTKLSIAYTKAGQHESITRRIAHIVRDYGTDIDIFKELIQNADDAGATEVKFLLDWRHHPDARLFTDKLKHWQGPALIAYNNAKFSDEDFDYICEVAGESKKTDPLKTGRFGIGFNATYHLTDLPSFISRRYLTIFDPHTKYLGDRVSSNEPGMRVDLVETKDHLKIYEDQFLPYDGVFGCNIFNLTGDGYGGTLFRFPFRSSYTSKSSDISPKIFEKPRVDKLVASLMDQKSELLLFLKHVKKITVYELPPGTKRPSQKFEKFSIECNSDHRERLTLMTTPPATGSYTSCCTQLTTSGSDGQTSDWLISSAHGHTTPMPVESGETGRGLLPLAEVALKIESSKSTLKPLVHNVGRLFCFLPLPNKSELSLHINGFFDVGKDRRNLSISDDKTFGTRWNEFISRDTLCVAFVKLLENLALHAQMQQGERKEEFLKAYYNLWKLTDTNLVSRCLYLQFKSSLPTVDEKILWSEVNGGCWLSPQEVYLFSDKLDAKIKNDAISVLLEKGHNIIEVPYDVSILLKAPLKATGRVYDYKRYCTEVFFPLIEEIDPDLRDRNIVFLLKKFGEHTMYTTNHPYAWAKDLLISTPCIPCQSFPDLRKPTELVNSTNNVLANLYDVEEGRFPIKPLLECHQTLLGLGNLGMARFKLKLEDLKERACTVSTLSPSAASGRSKHLLLYISQLFRTSHFSYSDFEKRKKDMDEVQQCLNDVPFIPVLEKPEGVELPWHGKGSSFVSPSKAFDPDHRDLLFTQCHVVSLPEGVYMYNLSCLGINGNLPTIDVVLSHFETLITSLPDKLNEQTIHFLDSAMKEVYKFINKCLKHASDVESETKTSSLYTLKRSECELAERALHLENKTKITEKLTNLNTVIWQDGHLLSVQQVCTHCSFSFYPYICELSGANRDHDKLFNEVLKVRDEPSVDDMVKILAQIKDDYAPDTPVSKEVLGFIESLVRHLSMKLCTLQDIDVTPSALQVFLPDDQCIMRPADQLACDKLNIEWIETLPVFTESFSSGTCYFVNGCIPRERAIKLGARPLLEAVLKEIEDEELLAGTDYGQHEDLCDRLNSILKKYQPDVTIFQEFIQNADDAQATEISFILDHRRFPDKRLLSHETKWKNLQYTPALCIFNNRKFQESDIIGITKLGRGGKDQSAELIGKFGIGFNVAYHVTDCPSFLSCDGHGRPENLCAFDPMRKFVPRASKKSPGKRWRVKEKHLKDFPDQFLPYLCEDLLLISDGHPECLQNICEDGYVVFRLPLTRNKSIVSTYHTRKHSSNSILRGAEFKPSDIIELFKEFSKISRDMLLFLNNLKCISAFEIKEGKDGSDEYIHHFTTTAAIATPYVDRHKQFSSHLKQCMKHIEADRLPTPYSGSHKVTVVHTETATEGETFSKEEEWLVQRAISGASENVKLDTLKAGLAQSLRPIGGVATLLSSDKHEYHLFCFLPMPIASNLPVQINGHFVVDDSRKHLETIKQGGIEHWNGTLMREIIIPAYIELVLEARSQMGPDSSLGREWYYKLFPGGSKLEGELSGLFSLSCFYEKLFQRNYPVLLLESPTSQSKLQCHPPLWKYLKECYFCTHVVCLATNKTAHVGTDLRKVFCSLGLPITDAPYHIYSQCSNVNEQYRSDGRIDPKKVCKHMEGISLRDPRCDIIKANIQIILEYCLLGYSPPEYQSLFQNSLFLVAANGSLKRNCLFSSHFAKLLPHCNADFVDGKLELSAVGRELYAARPDVIMLLSLKYVSAHIELPSTNVPVSQNVQSTLKLVELFWKYILSTVSKLQFSRQHFSSLFAQKAVLPTKDNKLFPVCLSKALLDVPESKTPSHLASAMRKLGYSELDFNSINLQGRADEFRQHVLHNMVCTCVSGRDIVDCMELQKPEKFDVDLTAQEVATLTYCLSNVSNISAISRYLLKMPLFLTVDKTFVALSNSSNLFVKPSEMPTEGVHEVQKHTNSVILVPPDQHCQKFYTMVIPNYSSACVTVQDFYKTLLLPNFPHLSDCQISKHINFIFLRDELFSALQNCLIRTPFIRLEGKLCLARQLYDPNVEFFRTFHPKQLLPEFWRKYVWKNRIIVLGLNTEVTFGALLSQAKQFQQTYASLSVKDMRKQSVILLENVIDLVRKCLEKHGKVTSELKDFLNKIAEVSFIIRSETSRLETLLECIRLEQKPTRTVYSSALVKLSESVSSKEADLSYLCRTVLPQKCDKLLTNSVVIKALRVEMPLGPKTIVDNLILLSKHFSSVYTVWHTSSITMPMQSLSVIFEKHYAYLNRCTLSSDDVTRLKGVMCILQRRDDVIRLVKPEQLVKILPSGLDLEPFCFRVASWMQAYENFLSALGVTEELKADDFASILTKIHNELEKTSQTLSGSSFLNVAISAYEGLVQALRQGGKLTSTDNSTLFLLDESQELVEASKVYDKDVPWHASRLPQGSNTYRYLHEPPVDSKRKRTIPPALGVRRLSEILVEKICDECMSRDVVCLEEDLFSQGKRQEDGRCKVVKVLLTTLQSQQLFDGFCRIYFHEHHGTPPTDSFISHLLTLKKLEVKCISTELKTELWDQGMLVPGTESTLLCHLVNNPQCLYVSPHCSSFNEDKLWLQVTSAIGLILEGEIQNQLLIKSMFECSPDEISAILDENKVIPFTMTDLKPKERKTVGTIIPLSDLSHRDSIIIQNYDAGELVCYLSDDGELTCAQVVDTKPMVDDILQPTITLRVAERPKADKNGSVEDGGDSESSSDDEQLPVTGEVKVFVSPLQVFKMLSPSQEAWLWKNSPTEFADPVILAPIPYSDSATLEEWITNLFYKSENLKKMSGLMASMVTIRLIGHMHYQLVVQNNAPHLFTTAVMLIQRIVSEKDLPCTVINKKHELHTSMNSLVEMVFKLSLDSDNDSSSDSDTDTPHIPPQSHTNSGGACGFGRSAGGGSIYSLRSGVQSAHLRTTASPVALGGSSGPIPSGSGRTVKPVSVSSQPRIPQPRTRRGYRAPQQNRRTRFPNVITPPPAAQAATAAQPPKPPPTCMQSAGAWLQQAKADFKAAEVLLHRDGPKEAENKFPALVCFLCHDSVEKCLKGAHYAFCGLKRDLVNNSSLVVLAEKFDSENSKVPTEKCPQEIVEVFKECAMFMNQHENRSRFPNLHILPCAPAVVYDVDSAEEAFEIVRRLFEELLKSDKLKNLLGDMAQLPMLRFASTLKSGSDSGLPTTWDPMTEDEEVMLSLLDPESPTESEEYERVAGAFLGSLPNAGIIKIDRVQNKLLWKRYQDRSERMKTFNNGILREQMLFHGTSSNDPVLIYKGDEGFDKRFCTWGLWGQGNYFATNASYSNSGFAYRSSQNIHKMFAAWVLTGISFDSPSNDSLRMPPLRDSLGRSETSVQRRYDCVTGMARGTRVYITYENDLAYPAYLITYIP